MRPALHFVGMMWREERLWLLAGAAASLLALLSAIALLGLSGWFITAAGLAGAAGAGLTFDFFRPSAGIRFFALFRTATRYGERLATHDATLRFLTFLRGTLFASVAANRKTGKRFRSSELLQRLTADLEAIDALYLRVLLPAVVAAALLLLGGLVLFQISVALAATVGAAFLACAAVLFLGAHFSRKAARRTALGSEALRVRTIDLVQAQTDLLLSGGLAAQRARIAKAADYLKAAGIRLMRTDIATAAGIALAGAGLTVALLLLAGMALEAGAIGGPVMVMLVIGGFAALEVFAPLRRGALELGRIAFSGKRLETLAAASADGESRVFVASGPAISIRDLSYRHGPDAAHILQQFSLTAGRGERIALVGRSGSGKSTLLSLIAGLLQPERGEISICRPDETRPTLGYLTQQTDLFKGSVADNLRIAAPLATDEALWHALEVAGLRDKIETLEGRLDWQLGETGGGLSGGERRRLALARLVLRNPQIWLLDEPTAGMDEALACQVMNNLLRHAPHATWLIAAHHAREIALANRTVRLEASYST